jgi:FixJ family two-component response regulator
MHNCATSDAGSRRTGERGGFQTRGQGGMANAAKTQGQGQPARVCIVDDDESVREALPDLLREFGFEVEAFASASDFLASPFIDDTRCLILDIAMPGMSGPELQRELQSRGKHLPIVFITAHAERDVRSRMLAQGAVECLFKPFTESALLGAIDAALRTH